MKRIGTAKVTFSVGDTPEAELPILEGTSGPWVVDVRKLYAQTSLYAYDPGFKATASCASAITYIDGEAGVLTHRGYPIEELAGGAYSFEQVAHLLLNGTLEVDGGWLAELRKERVVHEQLIQFYNGFLSDAHPMAIMVGVVGALSAFYHSDLDLGVAEHVDGACMRVIAKMPTLAALAYKVSLGEPMVYPRADLSHAANLLRMMFARPDQDYSIPQGAEEALNTWLILHADHEQNASTSTVRIAGSSGANPYACVASGITALWGPAHGGANEAVINMLEEIVEEGTPIEDVVKKAKDKNNGFRLMGFGHRVYKAYDPRARVLKDYCHRMLAGAAADPLFGVALELEAVALSDPYFVSRGLYPNTDFYSGLILRALGIPTSMFTVMFAVARCVGWVSQWKEMMGDESRVISRPRQLYVGPVGPPGPALVSKL